MSFRLRITEGKGAGREFRFSQATVRIGRLPENDLVLYDNGVSRQHCEIVTDGDTHTLRDTGSANGTLLNDVPTTEASIRFGDQIRVGPVAFAFEALKPTDDEAKPLPSRMEMFRPQSETQRKQLEEQATSAVSWKDLEQEHRKRQEVPAEREKRPASDGGSEKQKRGFAALPRSTRLAILLGLLLVGIAGTISALIVKTRPRRDRSPEIFVIDGANAALSFGAGKVDIYTPDRANFQFDYEGGRATVSYAAGGIELATELEILLNGQSVAHARVSPGRWTTGLKTMLPRRLLKPGTNVLTFDNTLTPKTDERWGVAQVQVVQQKLPPPDEKKAEELLDLGKAAYDTRSVAPQNLWRALQYFREAKLYLEGFDSPPPLTGKIVEAETRAAEELQTTYDSYLFAAEKAIRFGERDAAVASLREALRYFPEASDKRHDLIKRRLTNLVGRR
jgi:pSer/pThr/pTyr-binding forkhead associated (FHA) protein